MSSGLFIAFVLVSSGTYTGIALFTIEISHANLEAPTIERLYHVHQPTDTG
jgi:hypothetical protein